MHGFGFLFCWLAFFAVSASAETVAGLSAKEIVSRGQELLRGTKSSHARTLLIIVRPKFERRLEVESFHEGREKSFLIVHSPPEESGSRTLRLRQDVWTYTRKTEHPVKIPYSMMHTSWMGSDFTYEDIVKLDSLVTQYTHKILEWEKDPEGRSDLLVRIELRPHEEAPVVWGKVIWSAAVKSDGSEVIPVEEEDYNERGELIRRIRLDEIKIMDGRRIPTRLTCEMMGRKKGSKTVLQYREIRFDGKLNPKTFTLQTLQRGMR